MKKMLLVSLCMALVVTMHAQTLPAYLPSNGLVGWWPFNGNANDESGSGNHGTVNGATLTADRFGNQQASYNFSSNNNSISINHSNSLAIDNEITISVWINPIQIIEFNSATIVAKGAQGIFWNYGLNLGGGVASSFPNYLFTNYSIGTLDPISFSTWTHLLVSISESQNTFLMFVNGIPLSPIKNINANYQVSDFSDIINGCCSSPLTIGRNGVNDGAPFVGAIDDIAIYNRALTLSEITALYNGTTGVSGCTNATACNYNASATLDDGSCTFPTQTYLNCDGTCINDTDADGVCNELETPTLPTYLPTNGLVGYWPFNGNANDESGNGNHGTVNGAALTSDRNGNGNSAYSFDGNSNILISSLNSSLYFPVTYRAKIFATELVTFPYPNGGGKVILGRDFSGNYNQGALVIYSDEPSGLINDVGYYVGQSFASSNFSMQQNQWYEVVFSFDSNNVVAFYINGVLVYSGFFNYTPNVSLPFKIGAGTEPDGVTNRFGWTGKIDDIAIYNRALTQEEITALYTGTSSNNNGGGGGGTVGTPAASVPAGIPYQAVIRDNAGLPLVNAPVTVRFTLHQNTTDGTVEYQEAHALTTNAFGLVNTLFGSGTASQGSFANINWSATTKFVQVEANSGAGYVDMGTQQMMSVPFAMKSNESNKSSVIQNANLPIYANNAAALAGGLVAGDMYRTAAGILMIVY